MNWIPFFIEDSLRRPINPLVCGRIIFQLHEQGYRTTGSASSYNEAISNLLQMESAGFGPAIFVINTFKTENWLSEFEIGLGNTPILFLQRELYSLKQLNGDSNALPCNVTGPHACWNYGATNAPFIAQRATKCLTEFLKNGDFSVFEQQKPASHAGQAMSRPDAQLPKSPEASSIPTAALPFFGCASR